jgi:hypothetical protein
MVLGLRHPQYRNGTATNTCRCSKGIIIDYNAVLRCNRMDRIARKRKDY